MTTSSDKLRVPSAFWEGLQRVGLDRAEVVRRAHLSLGVLRDDAPISTAQFFALWRAVEGSSTASALGLRIADSLDSAVLPLAFVAAYHARDFRDAMERVARFKRLCAPEEVLITETEGRCEITVAWRHAGHEAVPAALVDATLASFLELGRRGTGERLTPVAVEFARKPAGTTAYERHFGCPVRFDAAVDRLVFRREDMDKRFASYNKELLEVLAPELDRRLEQHERADSVTEQTRWVLRKRMTAGRPDIRAVAAELAMSERSLQRRLTDEGTSFQGLLSATRHQLALEYLADPSLALMEVAFMLGYEDQNSFFRAFRQWESQTPSDWRATAPAIH